MDDKERFNKTLFPNPDFFNKLPDDFRLKFNSAVERTKADSSNGPCDLDKVARHHVRMVGLSVKMEISVLTKAVAHVVRNQDEPGEVFRSIEAAYNHWKILNPKGG